MHYLLLHLLLFSTSSAHSVFCSRPPSPRCSSLPLSLSLSCTVSPEASLSHHSSSFINTCTHTAPARIAASHLGKMPKPSQTHLGARKPCECVCLRACASEQAAADCTNVPEDAGSPVCPHAHTRLLCRKMPFVKGRPSIIPAAASANSLMLPPPSL